jgi:hypothetical protein
MKRRIPLLTVPFLALAASPAFAQQVLYDNGPVNGTVDAWAINFGYVVSDSFIFGKVKKISYNPEEGGVHVWESPGDVMTSLDWSITGSPNGGTVYASGTASGNNLTDQFISSNQYGYDLDKITFSGLNVSLGSGTYWLNLQNAVVPSGDPVYWDENSGVGCQSPGCPSQAYDSAVGTIPSESFTIYGSTSTGTTPEPSSLMLFVSGILSLAGMLRRKLF